MSHSAPLERGRLEYLDSLRGWAILGVLIIHCGAHFPGWIVDWTADGRAGVQLFYTLSAVTLFYTGRSQHAGERSFTRNFFIRRFFRIAPLFYLVLLVYLVRSNLWNLGAPPDHLMPLGRFLAEATFVNGFIPKYLHPVFGEWSIAVEMTFYALVPLFFRYIRGAERALYLTLVALLVNGYTTDWTSVHRLVADNEIWDSFRYYWFVYQFPAFACGILTYFLLQRPLVPKHAAPLMALALFFGLVTWENRNVSLWALPHIMQYELAFVPLILSLHLKKYRFFVNRAMSHLGRVSFSCYLLHNLVKDFVAHRIVGLPLPQWAQFVALLGAVLAGSWIVSALSYRYVELPGIALGKKLIARLDRGRLAEPAIARRA
jgi:peptidoglycan/LPS O-acetylase OafA/YrhL